MQRKKRIIFESSLEHSFYNAYKMLPFDMVDSMVADGFSRKYAFATVQRIMDNLMRHMMEMHEEEKRREMALLLSDCPWESPGAPT